MTASTQVGDRLVSASGAASRETTMPEGVGPVRPAAPTWPVPAPPAPIPPAAPVVPARPAPRAGVAHPPVRPHRAAHLVAVLAVTLAVVGGLSWLAQPGGPGVPQRATVVRVGAGETVWDVAARVAPRSDQRAVVERIRQLNGLAGSAVRADQQLLAPDGR